MDADRDAERVGLGDRDGGWSRAVLGVLRREGPRRVRRKGRIGWCLEGEASLVRLGVVWRRGHGGPDTVHVGRSD